MCTYLCCCCPRTHANAHASVGLRHLKCHFDHPLMTAPNASTLPCSPARHCPIMPCDVYRSDRLTYRHDTGSMVWIHREMTQKKGERSTYCFFNHSSQHMLTCHTACVETLVLCSVLCSMRQHPGPYPPASSANTSSLCTTSACLPCLPTPQATAPPTTHPPTPSLMPQPLTLAPQPHPTPPLPKTLRPACPHLFRGP